jgi:glycosyltransferase involved in cell wall biosynthesis
MRVLHLINSLGGGGAETALAALVTYLARNEPGISCDVATLYPTAQKFLTGKDFPFHCLCLDSKYSLHGITRLSRHLQKRNYDIVHVHLYPANYYAALVSFRFQRPIWIYTEQNVWNRRRAYAPLRPLEALVYSRFTRIVAVSELVATSLKRWLPTVKDRVITIPNSVPVPAIPDPQNRDELPAEDDSRQILFAGRLEHVKGVDILLQALATLPQTDTLLIAGEGSERQALVDLTVALGLAERVEFLGFRSDVQRLMEQADCVVLPSRWEGLPLVALEAMAVAAPVVATTVGGIPEVVEHAVTGWLVPPEDPVHLARALSQVLSDRPVARQVGRQARKRIIESYSVTHAAQKTMRLYAELLGRRGS